METGSLSRLHYLDALRAFALALVIPWHAANFFAIRGQGGVPLAGWIWFTHEFRMPFFFLLAGFFGAAIIARRGSARWLHGRLRRIGIPLAVGVLALAPMSGVLASWGNEPRTDNNTAIGGLTHPHPEYLWFLWYLLIAIAIWVGLRAVIGRWAGRASIHDRLHRLAASGWALPLLALPCALALWSTGNWGVYIPNSFAPPAGLLAYYTVFFAFGWLLGGRTSSLESLGRHPYRRLAAGVAVALPAFWLFIHSGDAGIATDSALRLGALYLGALCGWLMLDALIGLFRLYLDGHRPAVQYMADGSYWLYLSHMLFLAPIQLLMLGLFIPGAAQFAIAVTATFALTLVTYQLFVRYTAIGRILHGPRHRPQRPPLGDDQSAVEIQWTEVALSEPRSAG